MAINNKLLVVEDDPGLQSQIKWCFENYDVILADDRQSAVEQVKKHKPAVVTLDLGLDNGQAQIVDADANVASIRGTQRNWLANSSATAVITAPPRPVDPVS